MSPSSLEGGIRLGCKYFIKSKGFANRETRKDTTPNIRTTNIILKRATHKSVWVKKITSLQNNETK